jgi:DNA-binding transcriptional MerR regulator
MPTLTVYSPKTFAQTVGVCVKTLQRWDKSGFLVAGRTKTGRRVYGNGHLATVRERQLRHMSTF